MQMQGQLCNQWPLTERDLSSESTAWWRFNFDAKKRAYFLIVCSHLSDNTTNKTPHTKPKAKATQTHHHNVGCHAVRPSRREGGSSNSKYPTRAEVLCHVLGSAIVYVQTPQTAMIILFFRCLRPFLFEPRPSFPFGNLIAGACRFLGHKEAILLLLMRKYITRPYSLSSFSVTF